VIKSNKVYPTSPKITITVRMINNQIFQKEYGSPTIILPDIFVAAIRTGETKGNNNIGNNTSLNLARIAMPETKLAMAIIAQLINKVVPMAIQGCDGKSIIKNLKNGMRINPSIIVRKINPLIHFVRKINPRSIGALINMENASNSFS
jgi:hypothetical protein